MLRPIFASILGFAVILSLGGCVSLLPKAKPSQLYRFGADASTLTPPPASAHPQGSTAAAPASTKTGLVLGQVSFPRASSSDGILTVAGDQTAYIGGARWVAPARTLFQEAIERDFGAKSKATQIVNVGDMGPAGATLSIDVLSFEARYRRGSGVPTVSVSLIARLARADGRILDQRPFSTTAPARANSVSFIVKAFDQATDNILSDVVAWTDQQVSGAQPGGEVAAPAATTTMTTSTSTVSTSTTTPDAAPHR